MITKVKQTELYKDSQGEHIVCRGKLILIHTEQKAIRDQLCYTTYKDSSSGYHIADNLDLIITEFSNVVESILVKPIIISETEKIKHDDWVYDIEEENIFQFKNSMLNSLKYRKILVLPDFFSTKHLQVIINNKLEDRDRVYIKCLGCGMQKNEKLIHTGYHIMYHPIKLFPIRPQSWKEILDQYEKQNSSYPIYLDKWLEENYPLNKFI